MLLRALLVLLVILNTGVAAWWALRDAPDDTRLPPAPESPGLQLISEHDAALEAKAEADAAEADAQTPDGSDDAPEDEAQAQERPAADAPTAPAADTGGAKADAAKPDAQAKPAADAEPAAATAQRNPGSRCVSFGPFADATSRDAAATKLGDRVTRTHKRDATEAPRGWRVWMPPQSDRAAAEAIVAKMREGGFNDYYIMGEGSQANAIALGRFGSESGAQTRASALRKAGFDVQTGPVGGGQTRYWIDVTLANGITPAALQAEIGADRSTSIRCPDTANAG